MKRKVNVVKNEDIKLRDNNVCVNTNNIEEGLDWEVSYTLQTEIGTTKRSRLRIEQTKIVSVRLNENQTQTHPK